MMTHTAFFGVKTSSTGGKTVCTPEDGVFLPKRIV